MSKKVKAPAVIMVVTIGTGVGLGWYFLFRHPNTLPVGQTPSIGLPVYDFSHSNIIGAYGNVDYGGNQTVFHGGFDFGFNATAAFVAIYNAYIDEIRR
jgi:hypothetical protein